MFFMAPSAMAANNGAGTGPAIVPVGSVPANQGQVLCTAAINSNGTVAGGLHVVRNPLRTKRLAVGQYQVAFGRPCQDVRAIRGFLRWVQPDTHTIGTIAPGPVCVTADRVGVRNAVWVDCFNPTTGLRMDTNFSLFVAR